MSDLFIVDLFYFQINKNNTIFCCIESTFYRYARIPLASPLDAGRANICCRPGHHVLAQDHRLAAALNAGQRRSSPCNATCRQPSPKL